MDTQYYNLEKIKKLSKSDKYKKGSLIGGLWEELGSLQLNFLIKNGLKKNNKLLDIGCGELRGGIKFINYLDKFNYYGTDISPDLIDIGIKYLKEDNLENRINENTFISNPNFDFSKFNVKFDFVIAQSVFTHLKIDKFKLCLKNLENKMNNNGKFYFTFFENKNNIDGSILHNRENNKKTITYPNKDPYHYNIEAFKQYTKDTNWTFQYIGDWNHPRNQKMILLTYNIYLL